MAYDKHTTWLERAINWPLRWWFQRRHYWCERCNAWVPNKKPCGHQYHSVRKAYDEMTHTTTTPPVPDQKTITQHYAQTQQAAQRGIDPLIRREIALQTMNALQGPYYTNSSTMVSRSPSPVPLSRFERILNTLCPKTAADYGRGLTEEDLEYFCDQYDHRVVVTQQERRAYQHAVEMRRYIRRAENRDQED